MKHNTTKKYFASMLTAAGVAVISMFAATPNASAQCNECPDVGDTLCCPGTSLTDFQHAGYSLTLNALTNGCFVVTSCTPPPPCLWQVQMSLANFSGTGSDPVLGVVHWRNDPTRISTGSTITAQTPGSQFPAFGQISFYAEAEIDGVPGIYRSNEEVLIQDQNVMSWKPFRNEIFTRPAGAAPIVFTNDISGDQITLNNLTSILN
jgi:hypothetical protein